MNEWKVNLKVSTVIVDIFFFCLIVIIKWKENKMNVLKIVGVSRLLLESCTFAKSPNVKPIYEYKDGQRTEKVIGIYQK